MSRFDLDEIWRWFDDHPLSRPETIAAAVAAARTVLPMLEAPALLLARRALEATEAFLAAESPALAEAAVRASVELVASVHTPRAFEIVGAGALLPGAWSPEANALTTERAAVFAVRHAVKAVDVKNRDAARHAAGFAVLAAGRAPALRARAWSQRVLPALGARQ